MQWLGISNLNIINQKGLFVFNPDPTRPLEEFINIKNDKLEEISISYNPTLPKIKCYDIHKNLAEYVKKKINISENYIYPKEEEIAKSALKSFLKNWNRFDFVLLRRVSLFQGALLRKTNISEGMNVKIP